MTEAKQQNLFDDFMRPLTLQSRKMMEQFGRWIIAELHERGVQTRGFGLIDPKWLLFRHDYAKEDLQRWLTEEKLAYLLARVFFLGRPRTLQDGVLCQQCAYMATIYGLIRGEPCSSD